MENTTQPLDHDKTMGILAYIIFFVPLLVGNRTPFITYHTNQGTVLFIFAVAGQIALSILGPMIGSFGFGLLAVLSGVFNLFVLALMILGIINVTKNETKPLPIIGGFSIIK
ncbi:MAG: hypothetical protein AAB482_02575 [Patescibacteria group bacterium]